MARVASCARMLIWLNSFNHVTDLNFRGGLFLEFAGMVWVVHLASRTPQPCEGRARIRRGLLSFI